MLIANALPRKFIFDNDGQDTKLSDPDKKFTPEAVLNYYSNTYPILTTAKIEGPELKGDAVVFRFVSTLGTKG